MEHTHTKHMQTHRAKKVGGEMKRRILVETDRLWRGGIIIKEYLI